MNNDLEQFSEKRLQLLADYSGTNAELQWGEIKALARIALAAKQQFKVNATLRDINLNVSREAYSASLELNDLLKDNQHVYQIMNSVGDSQLWVDCSGDAYKCEIDEGGVGRILFTTPQPAHTEQGQMPDKALSLSETIGELRKYIDSSGGYNFEALRSEQVNSPVTQEGWVAIPKDMLADYRDVKYGEVQAYKASFGSHCDIPNSRWQRDLTDLTEELAEIDKLIAAAPKPESE